IGTLNEGALHAQLKNWYQRPGDRLERVVDGFVVDLVRGGLLVEIQTGSFAPLRHKLEQLTRQHRVRLVAPLPLVRRIIRLSDEGELLSARRSPRLPTREGVPPTRLGRGRACYAQSSFLRLTRARGYHASSTDVNPAIAVPVLPTGRSSPWKSIASAATVEQRTDERQRSL